MKKILISFIICLYMLFVTSCNIFAEVKLPSISEIKSAVVRSNPLFYQPGDDYRVIGWVLVQSKPYLFISLSHYWGLRDSKSGRATNRLIVLDVNLRFIGEYTGFLPGTYALEGKSKIRFSFTGDEAKYNNTIDFSKGFLSPFYAGGDVYYWGSLSFWFSDLLLELSNKMSKDSMPISPVPFSKNIITHFKDYTKLAQQFNLEVHNVVVRSRYSDTLKQYTKGIFLQYGRNRSNENYQFEYLMLDDLSDFTISGMKVIGRSKKEIITFFGEPQKIYPETAPGEYYIAYGGDAADDYVFLDFQFIENKVVRCTMGVLPPLNSSSKK